MNFCTLSCRRRRRVAVVVACRCQRASTLLYSVPLRALGICVHCVLEPGIFCAHGVCVVRCGCAADVCAITVCQWHSTPSTAYYIYAANPAMQKPPSRTYMLNCRWEYECVSGVCKLPVYFTLHMAGAPEVGGKLNTESIFRLNLVLFFEIIFFLYQTRLSLHNRTFLCSF